MSANNVSAKNFATTCPHLDEALTFMSELEQRLLVRELFSHRARCVLDLASGTGRLLPCLLRNSDRVIAIEPHAQFVARARAALPTSSTSRVTWHHEDARTFTLPHKVDAVVISGLLIFLSDEEVQDLATRVANLLRPGGRLWNREPVSTAFEWRRLENDQFPEAYYRTRQHLHRLLSASGVLRVRSWGYLDVRNCVARLLSSRLPPLLASRLRPALRRVARLEGRLASLNQPPEPLEAVLKSRNDTYSFAWSCFEHQTSDRHAKLRARGS